MDERRDILIELGWRVLLAIPFAVSAWILFSNTSGDPDGGWQRLVGLVCAVVAAIIVAPPLAALAAEPTGSLFYPLRSVRPEPIYSFAEAKRKAGKYEEAIREYETVAAQFPAEVRPYVAMIEIAYVNLHDGERADAIAKQALATLGDEALRIDLLRMHRAIKGLPPEVEPAPPSEIGRGRAGAV